MPPLTRKNMEITFRNPDTQRELVHSFAKIIYATHGHCLPDDLYYLENSQHPTEKAVLVAAEGIFEILTGDTPDYSDDPEEDSL